MIAELRGTQLNAAELIEGLNAHMRSLEIDLEGEQNRTTQTIISAKLEEAEELYAILVSLATSERLRHGAQKKQEAEA